MAQTAQHTPTPDDRSLSALTARIAAYLNLALEPGQTKAIEEMIDDHLRYWLIS